MATNAVFLDTNGWIALLNRSDALHPAADQVWRDLGRKGYRVVLTDWIVAETGNGLARTRARVGFARAAVRIIESEMARLVVVTEELTTQALSLYQNRADKRWGLIDCASFVVMEMEGLSDAFTNDRHFEQAGFRSLLKSP